MWSVLLIREEIDSKSLLGCNQEYHLQPPTPKFKSLAQSHRAGLNLGHNIQLHPESPPSRELCVTKFTKIEISTV